MSYREKCRREKCPIREKCLMGRNVWGRNVWGRNVLGRNDFWGEMSYNRPHIGKAKMSLGGGSFFQFSKICLHFSAVCLQFFKKNYCLSNAFWIYQRRVKFAQCQCCSHFFLTYFKWNTLLKLKFLTPLESPWVFMIENYSLVIYPLHTEPDFELSCT